MTTGHKYTGHNFIVDVEADEPAARGLRGGAGGWAGAATRVMAEGAATEGRSAGEF